MKRILILFVFVFFLVHGIAYSSQNGQTSSRNIKPAANTLNTGKRYAVLFPMALPFLFIINAQNGIVGYPGFGIKAIPYFSGNLILEKEPNFVKKTVDIGYPMEPNIEMIMKLHPNFVINSNFARVTNKRIEHFGIPVITFSGGFGTIEQLIKNVAKIGIYTNHTKQAEKYVKYYKNIISYVYKLLNKTQTKRPTVLYLSYEGPHGNKLTSGGRFNTLVNDIIQKAGCINVSSKVPGMFGLISTEDIIKWNPDYIIIGAGGSAESIYKNKLLKYTNAVKNKKVFKVPTDGNAKYSNWYAPEKSSLGLLWTAKVTHPKVFKSFDLRQAAAFYYKTFWGLDFSNLQIKGFLP